MTAQEKLYKANISGKFICVGLDTDPKKLPHHLGSSQNSVVKFNKNIIESTKDLCAAYKLNLAFYESEGKQGLNNLAETLSFIPEQILTIADGKRGDIGNTSALYARSLFEHFNFDASTLNPYMGKDSIEPFLSYSNKLNYILVLTSNQGSQDFQKQKLQAGEFLYQNVLSKIHSWNAKSNCGIVFGATNFEELRSNLDLIDDLPMLIPGVGAQGGSLEDVSSLLFSQKKKSFLINVSRGIIQRSFGEDFAEAARSELLSLNKMIEEILHS